MLIKGTFVHTPQLGDLEFLEDHLLAVGNDGFITHFRPVGSPESIELLRDLAPEITTMPTGSFLLPTFCDLHLHAPQFLYQGTGLDLPLMQWLDEYALKAEERLDADKILAKRVYERLAHRLLQNGTGTVMLFGTIKEETNLILAEAMQSAGVRAFVGKLSMDTSSRPTYVEASAEASLSSAKSFVHKCRHMMEQLPPHQRRIEPVLTPRFVPTCSDELLGSLGDLSRLESLRVQSHLAEAHDQVEWVRSVRGAEDIDIFDRNNLLTPRTVQAHCTFLTKPDLSRMVAAGSSIAHCPLSNIYFSTEPFPLREALSLHVKVGLGTDIAGGYSLDIMNAMRHAVSVSRIRESSQHEKDTDSQDAGTTHKTLAIDWKESLYLATRGGAEALTLPAKSGTFEVGSFFDAQLIQLVDPVRRLGVGALDFFDLEANGNGDVKLNLDMLEKWWCIGDTKNRVGMWVQGVKVL
ncbi:uncharacterized protein LACBIDRAFT_188306 [Laccaria bicolor S238N-H82]|uniref:Predicted protein n=1 Tax=Laccaria bicolor (strain S238N-H82 / ATCC MYA-4686) TaxID=486041 RepID=B0CX15_LACBS|nr:uncharacterized protein LACBIDRAFT_188306 [Laccaria bicolor S238N-H82]EDR13170.1 predicted protein [Laccaria bicolor S238N-H82]|eukprot:XP_001875668.1 predicted protein [Laccaria bicolor S238N-H82]